MKSFSPNLFTALLLILLVSCIGTIGYYWLLHDIGMVDALFMTAITLSTVGFRDRPHEPYSQNIYHIFYHDESNGLCL